MTTLAWTVTSILAAGLAVLALLRRRAVADAPPSSAASRGLDTSSSTVNQATAT